jgi:predicted restriction endonuclease
MKQKRKVDKKLLKLVGSRPCYICGFKGKINNDAHHVKSKKSGGDDVEYNLVSLCSKHHREIHDYGINKFSTIYPTFSIWLARNNWEYCSITNKWKNFNKAGSFLGE